MAKTKRWSKAQRYSRPRRDHNHATVSRAFVILGASVLDLSAVGGGCPDVLVGFRGRDRLVEVKNPKTSYGREGLTDRQKVFCRLWNGAQPEVVSTTEEVAALIKRWSEE